MKRLSLVCILFICSLPRSSAQPTDTTKKIDLLFSNWNNATPGGSIAISHNDKIIYDKAFGLADLEHDVPNTISTIFEGGSVSKQFTAASILLLVAEGKVSLQDDVRKFVPELPKYDAPITVQHLLNHTSGLKDWGTIGEVAGWPRTTRVYTQALALQIICKQKSLNFSPGTEYSYSNSNYTLLVTIVERVSKQSLAEFTRTRLFEPTGMSHTQWRNNFRDVIPHRAVAYSKSGEVFSQNMPFENIYGHGGLLTTTGDLLKWNRILDTHEIMGDQVGAWRVQKGKLNKGKQIEYAAGLFIDRVNGFDEIQHSGATAGYRAWLAYYPQKKLSVAILSNDGSFNPVTAGRKIAEIFLGPEKEKSPPPVGLSLSANEMKRYEGIYKSIRGFDVLTVGMKDGKIILDGHALIPLHKDTLFFNGTKYIWNKPNRVLLMSSADTTSFVRKNEPQLDPAFLKALAGDYFSEEADVTFSVQVNEATHEVWIQKKPEPAFKLKAAYLDGFLSIDFELYEFKRDRQGNVLGFEISLSRAERIPFTKLKQKK